MSQDNGHDDLSVVGLLEFLSELDSTRNPPVCDIGTEKLYELDESALPPVTGVTLTPAGASWLNVEYLDLPVAPVPPKACLPALDGPVIASATPRLRDIGEVLEGARAELARERQVPPEDITLPVELERELSDSHQQAQTWLTGVFDPWSEQYRDVERCKGLYRDLFTQQARLTTDRDSVEFVWGFGRLSWSTPEGVRVDAPLLAVPVEVELDSKTQALTVRPDGPLEVQTEYLASLSLHDRSGLLATRDALDASALDPWGEELTPTLRTLVRHLHLSGVIEGEGAAQPQAPVMSTGWVLFMRRRRPNYQRFLAALDELYRGGALVPLPMQNVVLDNASAIEGAERNGLHGAKDPLLLPLPANEEQLRILQLAQEPSGVVVQGPPGTGKTHTIANLISHYVAYGKRVLVLAEKERALREVSGKVPAGIRDLTVSVLGADEESRRQLGHSINVIQARVTGLDPDAADAEIERLTALLHDLDGRIATTTDEMLRSRELETSTLDAGSWPVEAPVSPQRAAEYFAAHESTLRRIPDRLGVGTPCPLTPGEIAELTRVLRELGRSRTEQALYELPDLAELPAGSEIALWHTQLNTAGEQLSVAAERITDWSVLDGATDEELESVIGRAKAFTAALEAQETGWLKDVAAQLRDPLLLPEWRAFAHDIGGLRERVITLRGPLVGHDVTLPQVLDVEFIAHIDKAVEHLGEGKKLGVFARSTRSALERCLIDGQSATTHAHAMLVQTAIALAGVRNAMTTRWRNQLAVVSGPALVSNQPEAEVREHLELLHSSVWLDVTWKDLTDDLAKFKVGAAPAQSLEEARDVVTALQTLPARVAQRQAAARIAGLTQTLRERAGELGERASVLWLLLADDAEAGSTESYNTHRAAVVDLSSIRAEAQRLRELHSRLAAAAPVWAQQVMSDPDNSGDPDLLHSSWQWRQLEVWVGTVLQTVSPDILQKELHGLVEERLQTVADLVTQRAWRRLADNLGDKERRGLNTYLHAVARYGVTGGKYEARKAAEIRRAMDECKSAVPVWVMTSARALTSFLPEAEPPFDVLILDEASQAGYHTLPLLSLARQVIVVGDEKQTSPENVGLDRSRVFELMDDHLRSVPSYRTLFDPDNSLYDIAKQRFTKSVMLVEHFRCLPDIIRFSNTKFYGDQIQPLRDRAPSLTWQTLGAVRVLDGYRSGDINRPEAEAVVELLSRLDRDPAYDGMSFGVVTLLSGGQAQLINDLLLDRLSPERFRARQLQVGEAAAFQGAERDVMVVSLVVAPDPNNPTRGPAAATKESDYRRLNVAASRAKQQMWVAYSVEPERFHPNDMRGHLIRHCRDPLALDSGGADTLDRCDSDFERRVATHILNHGYRRVRAQYAVGSESRNYRIDLVVEGTAARLAVECDGERWHGPDRWHSDHTRQQVLERAGWAFERIRGSAFYRDEAAALEPLWARLTELGITPGEDTAAPTSGQAFEVVGGRWRRPGKDFETFRTGEPSEREDDVAALGRSMEVPTMAASRLHADLPEQVPPPQAMPRSASLGAPPAHAVGPMPVQAPARQQYDGSDLLPATSTAAFAAPMPPPRAGSARDEILMASYRVTARTGRQDFTAGEVLDDLRSTGTAYAEGTIKTMISSHPRADGSLVRVARGVYRVASPLPRMAPSSPGITSLPANSDDALWETTPESGLQSYPPGSCQGCGKQGLVSNTHCRRCRNAGL